MQIPILSSLLPLAIPFSSFSSNRNQSYQHPGLTDWEAIHQTLHLYPACLDSKDWTLLPRIFTPEIKYDYSGAIPSGTGIPQLQATLITALTSYASQHMLGTTLIDIAADRKTANSTVYLISTQWLVPSVSPGPVITVFGHYFDHLIKTDDGWRIDNRFFKTMGPVTLRNDTFASGL